MIEIKLNIDNIDRNFSINQDYSLSWAIYQVQPSILFVVAHPIYSIPLWVLMNEIHIINADSTSLLTIDNSRIMTFQYALDTEYFRTLYEYLLQSGISLNLNNIPLILFSLHSWLQSPYTKVKEELLYLQENFPRYITQPASILQSYIKAVKNIDTLKVLYKKIKKVKIDA